MQTPLDDDLRGYSVGEFSSRAEVSVATVYRAIADGRIPARRIGARIVIPGPWVTRFFSDFDQRPDPESERTLARENAKPRVPQSRPTNEADWARDYAKRHEEGANK